MGSIFEVRTDIPYKKSAESKLSLLTPIVESIDKKRLYNSDELASFLGCSRRLIQMNIKAGKIAGIKFGGRYLVPGKSVVAALKTLAADKTGKP